MALGRSGLRWATKACAGLKQWPSRDLLPTALLDMHCLQTGQDVTDIVFLVFLKMLGRHPRVYSLRLASAAGASQGVIEHVHVKFASTCSLMWQQVAR